MQKSMTLWARCITVAILFFLLPGCGFTPRGKIIANNFPLKILHLSTEKRYNRFSIQLQRFLQSQGFQLTHTAKAAPYTLAIHNITFQYEYPALTTTSFAVSYTIELNFSAAILASDGDVIIPSRDFSIQRQLTLNTNQVLVPNIAMFARNEITRQAINILYYWLTSTEMTQQIRHYRKLGESLTHHSTKHHYAN